MLLDSGLPVVQAIAINGTVYPCDDEKGIPVVVFDGTEKNLTEENLLKFYRRMCAGAKEYENLLKINPSFPIPKLQDALRNIRIVQQKEPSLSEKTIFTEVVIGLSDRIFPTKNQQKAWENFPNIQLEEMAHYDEEMWKKYSMLCQQQKN
jgi:biotin synthesis protein BioG